MHLQTKSSLMLFVVGALLLMHRCAFKGRGRRKKTPLAWLQLDTFYFIFSAKASHCPCLHNNYWRLQPEDWLAALGMHY